ncbi:MAG: hypothetical protein JWN64_257 [Parcubacteria group bacterium]|nr:hypothetical protein [Parcubacteria group bacterium]
MNDFLKMDIFFGVTTVAVIVVTVLLVIVLVWLIRILKRVEHVSELVEEEGEHLRDDIADVRAKVRSEGLRLKHMFSFFKVLDKPKRRRSTKS